MLLIVSECLQIVKILALLERQYASDDFPTVLQNEELFQECTSTRSQEFGDSCLGHLMMEEKVKLL